MSDEREIIRDITRVLGCAAHAAYVLAVSDPRAAPLFERFQIGDLVLECANFYQHFVDAERAMDSIGRLEGIMDDLAWIRTFDGRRVEWKKPYFFIRVPDNVGWIDIRSAA